MIYRTVEKVFLILLIIFSFYYCLDFGYILTNYGHGGQLSGIPFALAILIYSLINLFTKNNQVRNVFRIINYVYVLSMLGYVLTVLYIKSKNGGYEYLYHFDANHEAKNGVIFNGYMIGGLIICALTLMGYWYKYKQASKIL